MTINYREEFDFYFPYIARDTVEFIDQGEFEFMVTLRDGSVIIFDWFDKTIRNYEPGKNPFGTRLRKIMRNRGITQLALSDMTGIRAPLISLYVNGRTVPSFYTAEKIAKTLNCSLDDFGYR
jgi:DNA-binding XRE family transcriptional regulator